MPVASLFFGLTALDLPDYSEICPEFGQISLF